MQGRTVCGGYWWMTAMWWILVDDCYVVGGG